MHRHLNRFKGKRIIALVAVLGIILITAGATYAWFSYSKSGAKENTISAGSITFHYKESSQGLTLDDAVPMTDSQGMAQTDYFDFTITSNTSSTVDIPYYITARRSGTGTNMDNVVKVYLTKVDDNGTETPIEIVNGKQIATFSELGSYTNSDGINIPQEEKLLAREIVFAGSNNYKEKYRLRMWIDEKANFIIQQDGQEDIYPYNGKTYTLKVNVYGSGVEVNQSVVDLRSNTNIIDIQINGNMLTTTTKEFETEIVMPAGEITTTKDITITTENPNATVTVTPLTTTASTEGKIKRLASTHRLELKLGENKFRVDVTSEDKKQTDTYTLTITTAYPSYDVTMAGNNVTFSKDSINIGYGSQQSIVVTPANGYYISGGNCTNGYIITGLTTGTTAISAQTITINNNDNTEDSMCIFNTTPITYAITYNLNSGTQASNPITSYTIETNTFSLPSPTRTGYTFDGWYGNSSFTGNSVTEITKGTTGNKTYYAKWTPSIPTMAEMCPDCVFAYTTDTLHYSGTSTTLKSSQYKENYEDVVAETGKDRFLGLKLDKSGTIEKAYACGIKDGTPFCIEGSTDGSSYPANKDFLNRLYGPYDRNTELGCGNSTDGSYVSCFGSVNANALNSGQVYVFNANGRCTVHEAGVAYCYEL